MLGRIDLVTLLVDDVSTCKAFYRDVLGFAVHKDRGDYVELESSGARLALYPRRGLAQIVNEGSVGEPRRGQAVVLSLPVDRAEDVDRVYRDVVLQGARSIGPPGDMPWGLRAAFILDPDGNLIEIFAKPQTSP